MNVNPNYIQQLTAALSRNTAQQQVLSSQISSGVRLTGLGDDPVAAAQNVQFSAQIAADSTFTQTAATTTARMQVADSTLGSVVDQINQAISVATAGNNGTNNASDQSSVARNSPAFATKSLAWPTLLTVATIYFPVVKIVVLHFNWTPQPHPRPWSIQVTMS